MPVPDRNPQTLYDKVLSHHIVDEKLDGTILYIGPPPPCRARAPVDDADGAAAQTGIWSMR